jgi:hypothetical protein
MPPASGPGAREMMSAAKRSREIPMHSIPTPPDNIDGTLSPPQKAVHSRSARLLSGTIFNPLRRFLQETVARHRVFVVIHSAAVLNPDIRVKLKSLVKRILVSIGHRLDRLVEGPSVQALFTRLLSMYGLRDV